MVDVRLAAQSYCQSTSTTNMKVGKKNESGKKKENVENVLVQASNLTRLENVVK